MYGLHNIGAAESIATYLDAVVVPTLNKARLPSVTTESKGKVSAVDTGDGENADRTDDHAGLFSKNIFKLFIWYSFVFQ